MFRFWCEDDGFVPPPARSRAVTLYATGYMPPSWPRIRIADLALSAVA